MSNSQETSRSQRQEELVIDGVLSAQPELGPSVPDGGYGWIIFAVTLFFQALVPGLTASFGIFLCYRKFEFEISEDTVPSLWDNKFIYVPLFFIISWTISEPFSRTLINNSIWPRLVAVAATCLTCSGLLFTWMGLEWTNQSWLYVISGIVGGFGASLQLSQCDILVAQYFKLKHEILVHVSYVVTATGFILTPAIIGKHLFQSHISNVLMWYQAILLQGLILILFFKKPEYLKSSRRRLNYLPTNQEEDEEDIFSKNSKELQIKRENKEMEKIVLNNNDPLPGTSSDSTMAVKNQWETFEDNEEMGYARIDNNVSENKIDVSRRNWETFTDDDDNLQKSHPLNTDLEETPVTEQTNNINTNGMPVRLFSDLSINYNTTYSFDDAVVVENPSSNVFISNVKSKQHIAYYLQLGLLREPSFYKTLLMVITTKFSYFIFFTTFPTYMYQEVNVKIRPTIMFMAKVSLMILFFALISFWVNVNKQRRPIVLWVLCWVGAAGYLLISDSLTIIGLKVGSALAVLSIAALDYIGKPLLGLTFRGEQRREFLLISILSGLSFMIFLCFDIRLRICFRLMAILHFATGCIWFTNFVYKKIKEIH